ncbi:Dot/Icm T4SS effector [Legionella lansingensis]|uniref:Dot/Icm T4SS effector n=1 Tax=Legionella lansingensis TaxID=45067 RepID=A0A0W0VK10_9GAMM|nr:hypothetical protein [Legionella lansingensis]KTD20430.1 Dot/Icm T4SS effector [Legionella lansingensis]SNV49997.1 Dot/Icm T4SS effector [Legionella lansingensis]
MISKGKAQELLNKYKKDLEAMQENVKNPPSHAYPSRGDFQVLPNLIQALECIAEGKVYKATDYVGGQGSIGHVSRDPQEAFANLSSYLDERFLRSYSKDNSTLFKMTNFCEEIRKPVAEYQERREICNQALDKISDFIKKHPGVDGLEKMQGIINSNASSQEKLSQIIELAKYKKSDFSITQFVHEHIRGRKPEVENFYQEIAKLDMNNTSALKEYAKPPEKSPEERFALQSFLDRMSDF